MKVLIIGTDRNLFKEGSAVSKRIKAQAALVEEMHIIIFSKRELGFKEKQLAPNAWIYPTNSVSRWFYTLDASRMGKRLIRDKKFVRGNSVISAQDPFECGKAALTIKRKWRLPLEVQLHTDPFSPFFSGFLNLIRKQISKKVLTSADSIRVVSKEVGYRIVERFSVKKEIISVLPIYIDTEKIEEGRVVFDLHSKYGWKFVLLSVARLTKEKNLPLALEVLKRVRVHFPETGLVIVGSGPEEKNLKSLAEKLGVARNVIFAGWQEDMTSYYKTANVFLQTSYFEGYGMALVEAGLSGLPVVTTPVGIANELKNGEELYVCPQNDPEYMFRAVYDLLENNQKRELMSIRIKEAVKGKLFTKEEYLIQLKNNWEKTSLKI